MHGIHEFPDLRGSDFMPAWSYDRHNALQSGTTLLQFREDWKSGRDFSHGSGVNPDTDSGTDIRRIIVPPALSPSLSRFAFAESSDENHSEDGRRKQ